MLKNHPLLLLLLATFAGCDQAEKTGTRSVADAKPGVPDGPYVEYFRDSSVKAKGTYKNGVPDGEYIIYFNDGKIDKQMFFANGKKQGLVKVYYPSGQVKHETNYTDGDVDGESKEYYPDGKMKIFMIVRNHKTLYSVKYDKKGDQVAFDREILFTPKKNIIKLGEPYTTKIYMYTLPTEKGTVYIYEKNRVNDPDSVDYNLSTIGGEAYLVEKDKNGEMPERKISSTKRMRTQNDTLTYQFTPTDTGSYKLLAVCVVIPEGTNLTTSSSHDLEFKVTK